jgi:type IV fimbrial biogenesis protein FimT
MTINRRSPTWGFTLVELMVTLGVFAVLLGLAVPSFMETIASNRVTTATNDILTALTLARSEAIRRNQRVTACTSTDAANCAGSGSSWTEGWIVFVDPDHDARVDAGETVIRSGPATGGDITIVGNRNVNAYVSYAPDGMSKLTSGAFQAGTLRICSSSPALTDEQRARDIAINSAGRTTITTPTGIAGDCPAP